MDWFSRKEEHVINHCDIGEHDVVDEWVSSCGECGRRNCHRHQGNPDTIAGNEVACPDHVEVVEERNRRRWGKIVARQK